MAKQRSVQNRSLSRSWIDLKQSNRQQWPDIKIYSASRFRVRENNAANSVSASSLRQCAQASHSHLAAPQTSSASAVFELESLSPSTPLRTLGSATLHKKSFPEPLAVILDMQGSELPEYHPNTLLHYVFPIHPTTSRLLPY